MIVLLIYNNVKYCKESFFNIIYNKLNIKLEKVKNVPFFDKYDSITELILNLN